MDIIEYTEKYSEKVKDLFVELQEYIENIDKEGFNVVGKDFREKYFSNTLENVQKYEGKIFLALDKEELIGVIVGVINNDIVNNYDFKAPKRGRIVDLVITKNYQGMGIGSKLIKKMEDYFKSVNCSFVLLDVFAYNESASLLYKKLGYNNRNIQMMKNI